MPRILPLAALLSVLLPAAAGAQVSGVVRDQLSLNPIQGARVTLQATTISTVTDGTGAYSLPGAIGGSLVIVAARKGYYNESILATSPSLGADIDLRTVPAEEDTSYSFTEPNLCGSCHDQQSPQWQGSPMAMAGQNTWVYDIYNGTGTAGGLGGFVYTRDSRYASSNPNSECASCHQPEPWVETPFSPLEPIGGLTSGALHGVSCDVCHKIAHIDETKLNFPGIHPDAVTFTRPSAASGQVQYGALGDADFSIPMFMQPSYQPQLPAEVCAACHQDKNDPDEDGDFEGVDGVISEPTYGEWAASSYADTTSAFYASCADCHMPSYGAVVACNVTAPIRDPETIRSHDIRGTTAAYLENAVSMALACNVVDDSIDVQVSITNDATGHHVPTGVTIRNMILLVEAWRDEDSLSLTSTGTQTVHDLGGIGDPALGQYAGVPGKFFAKVNHDSSGQGPTFFTDATGILFDNRIPALATDVSNYSFQVPPGGGTLKVRARLIYRRSFRFLTDAKGWTKDGHGVPLEDVTPPYYGHLMEEEEWAAIVTSVGSLPDVEGGLALQQSRPNPAHSSTTIRFGIPEATTARLTVFDLQGRVVRSLLDGTRGPGEHSVTWDLRDDRSRLVANGVYLYRLETGAGQNLTRRLVLLR